MSELSNLLDDLKVKGYLEEILNQGLQALLNEIIFDNVGAIALLEGVPIYINGYNYSKTFQTSEYKFSKSATGIVNTHTRELPAIITLTDCYFSRDAVGFFVEKARKEPNTILSIFSVLQKAGNTLLFITPDFAGQVFLQNYNIVRTTVDKVYFNITLKVATDALESIYQDDAPTTIQIKQTSGKTGEVKNIEDVKVLQSNNKSLIDTNLSIQVNLKNYNKVQFYEIDVDKSDSSNLFNLITIPVGNRELPIYYTVFQDTITLHYPNKFLLNIDNKTPNKIGIYYEEGQEYYIIFSKLTDDTRIPCSKSSVFNIYKLGVLINA